jgi:hypothetical protein
MERLVVDGPVVLVAVLDDRRGFLVDLQAHGAAFGDLRLDLEGQATSLRSTVVKGLAVVVVPVVA